MAKRARKLSAQQKLFAHEYLVDKNATQAAIRAGYSAKSAYSQASDLLKKPELKKIIERGLEKSIARTELKLDEVLLELRRILLADPLEALNDDGTVKKLSEWPEDVRRALSAMEVQELFAGVGDNRQQVGSVKKMKFWSKTASADQLMKHLGGYQKDNEQKTESLYELISLAVSDDE